MGVEILAVIMIGCFVLGGIMFVTGKRLMKYVNKKEMEEKEKLRSEEKWK
jgi:uncharacterized protein YneF (UPF0154 family)